MLRRPLRGCFMWPFDVAGLGIRYLQMDLALRCGAPRRKPVLMALSRDVMGGLHKLWCMNLTAFVLVVRWYKNDASAGICLNRGCGA